jgi:hypothetical protein
MSIEHGNDRDSLQALRRQMAAQRGLISSQLTRTSAPDEFPRSMTMRLLTRQPALVGKLAMLLAARLGVGKRLAFRLGAMGIAAWLARTAVQRIASQTESQDPPRY